MLLLGTIVECLCLAVTSTDVDFEQIIEDATLVRDDHCRVQGFTGVIFEGKNIGAVGKSQKSVLLFPFIYLREILLH